MKANKDGGTSVGFSSSDCICGKHSNHLCVIHGDGTDGGIDFKIEENLSEINKQQWEDIINEFNNQNKGKIFYGTFFDWLKENYFPPEKKNT